MTTQEVKKRLRSAKLKWPDFIEWMSGQTVGVDSKGEADWYDTDVYRFIRGRGNLPTLD